MNENNYMPNMQKILFLVKELHNRGFYDICVIPSLSPSGLSRRCSFLINGDRERIEIISSNWIQEVIDIHEKNINAKEWYYLYDNDTLKLMKK
ncbi:MAG: hypothetical protein M0P27_02970 [Bacteroidales bacterium]|nr:hypothetical protein [Bacteroidales bacterium]